MQQATAVTSVHVPELVGDAAFMVAQVLNAGGNTERAASSRTVLLLLLILLTAVAINLHLTLHTGS